MRIATIILTAALATLPMHAEAGNGNKGVAGGCPPGLAKKNPPCIPPGLAMKYRAGDFIRPDEWQYYMFMEDWQKLGFERPGPGEGYYKIGDAYVKMDRESGEIITLFDALLNVLDTK